MNKNNFLQYIKSILIAISIAACVIFMLLGVIQYQVVQEQHINQSKDEKVDYYMAGVLIEKYKYLELQNPDNYQYNLKMANLYEMKKDYTNAVIQYKRAIGKAAYGEYKPTYELAVLYVNLNRLDEAQALMDNFGERPDKILIDYKADVFEKLGDKYFSNGDYESAVEKYQKSLTYIKIVKSKQEHQVKENLVSAYVYLANEKVNQMDIEDAIDYLEMADTIIEAPLIEYQLALLLSKDYPDLAYRYYEKVYKAAPEIINYDEYCKFLNELIQEALAQGNYSQAELYKYKIKELKDYRNNNVVSVEDIELEYAKGDISLSPWTKKYHIDFQCRFKNLSKNDIDFLNLHLIFKTKDKILYIHSQELFNDKSVLKAGMESPIINIKAATQRTADSQLPKEITAQVYVSKLKYSYRILLKEIPIEKRKPRRIIIKLFHHKFVLPLIEF